MVEPISLNKVRKARARASETVQAAANRAAHGRTGAQKKADRLEQARRTRALDGAERET